MSDEVMAMGQELARHLLETDAQAPASLRRAAFDNEGVTEPALRRLVDKVATASPAITDHDIADALEPGITEAQLVELVICAAVGEASRMQESALRALAEAEGGH